MEKTQNELLKTLSQKIKEEMNDIEDRVDDLKSYAKGDKWIISVIQEQLNDYVCLCELLEVLKKNGLIE